jgi:glyoxylase-like metal-dependent hydrolase (beta-lactamase superfamily II)
MSKSIWIRFAGVAVLAGGAWVAFTQQQQPQPLQIVPVKDNLHVIYGSGGNVAVLTTPEGVVLVDDKFDRNVPEILARVKQVTAQPVKYIFNTHHHGDHSGGNAQLGKAAQLISQEKARDRMAAADQASAPNLSFSEQQTLYLGGAEVRAIHLGRSHTDGDAVIFFPQLRVIHTGDMFVRGAPFIDYSSGGSALEWDDTLNEVLQLEFDTVIPGHGEVCTREELTQWKADFETFRSRVSQLIEQGKSEEEIKTSVKVSDLKGWSVEGLMARSLTGLIAELR